MIRIKTRKISEVCEKLFSQRIAILLLAINTNEVNISTLSLRATKGSVAISLVFMRLLRRFTPCNDILINAFVLVDFLKEKYFLRNLYLTS